MGIQIKAAQRLSAADGKNVKELLKGADLKQLKTLIRVCKLLDIKHLEEIYQDVEENKVVFNLSSDIGELCDNLIETVQKMKSHLKSKLP